MIWLKFKKSDLNKKIWFFDLKKGICANPDADDSSL